jgi:hypothetical protein
MIGPKAERIGDESLPAQISRSVRHNILCPVAGCQLVFQAVSWGSFRSARTALTSLFRDGTAVAGSADTFIREIVVTLSGYYRSEGLRSIVSAGEGCLLLRMGLFEEGS